MNGVYQIWWSLAQRVDQTRVDPGFDKQHAALDRVKAQRKMYVCVAQGDVLHDEVALLFGELRPLN